MLFKLFAGILILLIIISLVCESNIISLKKSFDHPKQLDDIDKLISESLINENRLQSINVNVKHKLSKRQAASSSTVPSNLTICVGGFAIDITGTTFCTADINGQKRAAYEVDCIFPFQYKGVWYDKCTSIDNIYYWCSLDTFYNSKYAYCDQDCPLLARNLVINDYPNVHTSCSPPNPKAVGYFPNETQINVILDAHNSVRSNVVPTASDLRVITWDNGLARLAQRRAETCMFQHDCYECRKLVNNQTISIGQNAYYSFNFNYDDNTFWNNVVGLWANEAIYFNYGLNSAQVGHYTQIVNSGVGRVGCGAAKCDASFYVYCNYALGQVDYNTPFTPGVSCSKCPTGQCINNLCVCTKFCQNGGTLNSATCSCNCPAYTTGNECEILNCSRTDADYGCWALDQSYCVYSNIPPICPNLCKICRLT